ncbi:MAG: carbamoyltransferase HypF [Chitinophagaceae bacterium]|nr:carbamoyltransferase HypF [Chitinophagaceae bacterium]
MHTYHIHINGLVQGVGFRPLVCRLANELGITGRVSNTTDGVHIECSASIETANAFYNKIISAPPGNAIITHHHMQEIPSKEFFSFTIEQSTDNKKPDLLLTPDIALCNDCREELLVKNNKRYHYPFTTCLNCGPRYSIITALPYDRANTTMQPLQMCDACLSEYNDITDRRHYSQTNSCKDCAVPMYLFVSPGSCISNDAPEIVDTIAAALKAGQIIAVKGIGGYLLLCDATNEAVVNQLRVRKQRPAKPFALMYASIEMAAGDLLLRPFETAALQDKTAPIVLCELKTDPLNGICAAAIAPGLDKVGLMLAYTPLLLLIAGTFGKPLIATSGNISGSPIIYKDRDALLNLFEVADYVLTYEREIVAPQDDSVLQFCKDGQKIILRRSRGLAPNYFPNPFCPTDEAVLAMGAELKAAFTLLDKNNLYISQFLGDQGTLESQTAYKETLEHVTGLLHTEPAHVLVDKHPGYFVAEYGKEIAAVKNNSLTAIQHHKAHFGAVLAENNLLNSDEQILGFVWDGTGYGDDRQVWGGEIFIYEENEIERIVHLDYFPQLLADKMSREPRLSALSLLKNFPAKQSQIQKYFSAQEWKYYQQLVQQPADLLTSSMGRFLDGIACILGICQYNTYEGEAAMKLEVLARSAHNKTSEYYPLVLQKNRIEWDLFLTALLDDCEKGEDIAVVAWKLFFSLAKMVEQISDRFQIEQLAFSGGVFQNALLNELLVENLSQKKTLYFHRQLSPNDECIGFGQMACFEIENRSLGKVFAEKNKTTSKQIQFSH